MVFYGEAFDEWMMIMTLNQKIFVKLSRSTRFYVRNTLVQVFVGTQYLLSGFELKFQYGGMYSCIRMLLEHPEIILDAIRLLTSSLRLY